MTKLYIIILIILLTLMAQAGDRDVKTVAQTFQNLTLTNRANCVTVEQACKNISLTNRKDIVTIKQCFPIIIIEK